MAKRYSPTEIKIVQDEIIRNPTNLAESFENASNKLKDRTTAGVKKQWYTVIRYQKAIIFLSTPALKISNAKNIPR